jgi:post-segregation antitoxin (ccd killing protein)
MISQKTRCNIWIPYNLRVAARERGISISKVTTEALKKAIAAATYEGNTDDENE